MTIRQGQTVIAGLSSVTNAVDNSTITVNGSNKIQANGILNQNTSTVKYDWVGTLAQYNALNSYNDNWTYFITDDNVTTTTVQPVIGQIVQVVCAEDYIPDGCLPCDGTEYSRNTFSDLWTNYLTSDPVRLAVCSYSDYSSAITTYGQCGKFAVDSVNGKFKTPYIKDGSYITQALSDSELGKSYNESLPNITGTMTADISSAVASGALKITSSYSAAMWSGATSVERMRDWAFNASYSSSTYQDNAKVQGDNVRARYFVVVVDGHINQSMMDWSQWTTEMNNKADLDLANTGRITNCVTYIPQDIKLELSNGTLTLKSGSKVYVPNGSGVFDIVTISNDLTSGTIGTYSAQLGVFYYHGIIVIASLAGSTSGTTPPSSGVFYNTSTNKVQLYSDGSLAWDGMSFPIALVTHVSGVPTSIDQVFNGFGYIGSTVFALPGVKGLIPNGRNSDGSLKNIEIVTSSVRTMNYLAADNIHINLYSDGNIAGYASSCVFFQGSQPSGHTNMLWYNTIENKYYYTIDSGSTWYYVALENIGTGVIADTTGTVSSITPKTVYHGLDYNDKTEIVGWGMPDYSSLVATGLSGSPTSSTTTTYTCPTNGWLNLMGYRSSSGYSLMFYVNGTLRQSFDAYSATYAAMMYPVNSGDVIKLTTNNSSATWVVSTCNFVPCKGAK